MRLLLNVFGATVLAALAPVSATTGVSPSVTIVGTVTLTAADGSTWAGDGARVALVCDEDRTSRTEVADDHGAFRFLNVPFDRCSIEAEMQGFFGQPVTVDIAAQQVVAIALQLGVVPLHVGVNVGGATPIHRPKTLPRSSRSDTGPR